ELLLPYTTLFRSIQIFRKRGVLIYKELFCGLKAGNPIDPKIPVVAPEPAISNKMPVAPFIEYTYGLEAAAGFFSFVQGMVIHGQDRFLGDGLQDGGKELSFTICLEGIEPSLNNDSFLHLFQ